MALLMTVMLVMMSAAPALAIHNEGHANVKENNGHQLDDSPLDRNNGGDDDHIKQNNGKGND